MDSQPEIRAACGAFLMGKWRCQTASMAGLDQTPDLTRHDGAPRRLIGRPRGKMRHTRFMRAPWLAANVMGCACPGAAIGFQAAAESGAEEPLESG